MTPNPSIPLCAVCAAPLSAQEIVCRRCKSENPQSPLDIIAGEDPFIAHLPEDVWPLPQIDYRLFVLDSREVVKGVIGRLESFLHAPYLLDKFAEHAERRLWIEDVLRGYGDHVPKWYDQNCLRHSRICKITSPDSLIDVIFVRNYIGPRKDALFIAAENLYCMNLDRGVYDQKSLMEKVVYVLELKYRLHEFLEVFGEGHVE